MPRTKDVVENLLTLADIKIDGGRPYDITVHNEQFYARVLSQGSLGLGESYLDGWWDCDQLDEFFYRILWARLDEQVKSNKVALTQLALAKFFNLQSRRHSFKVAEVHYNLDNDLYERMLGPSMAYTCGYWLDTDDLDTAQFKKYDLVCRKLGLKRGDRVLELGCGWGGFAAHAAEHYGCELVSVSISSEQIKFAKERYAHLPIEYVHCDYRDRHVHNTENQLFDAVVSIGMCEHVGYKNYGVLMDTVYDQLEDHGLFLLHTIGGNKPAKTCEAWTNKYIFPNGVLPSIQGLAQAFEGKMVMEDWHNFGMDYDTTLMAWYHNFVKHWPVLKERFDERFYRMWCYYLLSCAGMFRARSAQLWQVVLSKNGYPGGYRSVR